MSDQIISVHFTKRELHRYVDAILSEQDQADTINEAIEEVFYYKDRFSDVGDILNLCLLETLRTIARIYPTTDDRHVYLKIEEVCDDIIDELDDSQSLNYRSDISDDMYHFGTMLYNFLLDEKDIPEIEDENLMGVYSINNRWDFNFG